jgi:hypothetical protein
MTEKTHTLTIAGLDDFEAEHISHLLHGYEGKMLVDITRYMAQKKDGHVQWCEEHLAWHKKTMEKIKWKAEEVENGTVGSSFDDFLKEQGTYEETIDQAETRIAAHKRKST